MRQSDYIIRVYSNDSMVMAGLIEHVVSGLGYRFHSLAELVLLLQLDMDRRGFPEAQQQLRNWAGCSMNSLRYFLEREDEAGLDELQTLFIDNVPLASFWVSLRFRQNACWQGELVWMEQTDSTYFRSLLELIILIQDALLDKQRLKVIGGEGEHKLAGHQSVS